MLRKVLATITLLVVIAPALAAQRVKSPKTLLPKFDDYPVSGSPRTTEKIIVIYKMEFKETPAHFRNRIREAAKIGPNFVGHYTIVGWSCGMICFNLTVVDVSTGRSYGLPFLGISDGPCPSGFYPDDRILVSFRRDSRLMILRGSTEEIGSDGVQDQPCSTRYYLWKRNRLALLRKIVAPDN